MERPFMSTFLFMEQPMGARLMIDVDMCDGCDEAKVNCECDEGIGDNNG